MVPLELRSAGRPAQIWRSLKTADRKRAELAYAATHAEIELLFAQWRKEEKAPSLSFSRPAEALACASTPLMPGLLRRLADTHYLDVYDKDFRWRGDLWKQSMRRKTRSGAATSSRCHPTIGVGSRNRQTSRRKHWGVLPRRCAPTSIATSSATRLAGYAVFGQNDDQDQLLLHPTDTTTGLSYSLLPMTRGIIAGLFTPQQARHHLRLIRENLLFPDGVR